MLRKYQGFQIFQPSSIFTHGNSFKYVKNIQTQNDFGLIFDSTSSCVALI